MAEADFAYVATAGAAGLALAVSAWAARLRTRLNAETQRNRARQETATLALGQRDSMLTAFDDISLPVSADGVAGTPIGSPEPLRRLIGQADDTGAALLTLLQTTHRQQIQALVETGEPFESLISHNDELWRLEGRPAGGQGWLRLMPGGGLTLMGAEAVESGLALLADASPVPTWVMDGAGKLAWVNRAWLADVGAETLDEALEKGLSFDRGADTLAAEAGRLGIRQEGFRWTTGGGRRRAWRIIAEPAGGGAVTVFAIEVTEAEETRDTLRRHVEAHDETLNHLADAVAIFGPSKRLAFHNTAFQTLFDLDAAWLDERPTHAELLDRLRQRRRLPEVVDYAQWKGRELEFYGASEAAPDDSWSLPDGRTLRVVRQPHPLGGILLLFSDITGELQLRSRFNSQIQVQRATLDKLNDAVAVFGSDGRLRLHNEAFEHFWQLPKEFHTTAQDFDTLAELCKAVLPDPALWLGLKARVADPDPESRVPISGEGRTLDGRTAAWQTRPLPDGATLVAFSDVTARRELEQALVQREQALAESQALKREFVGSVSYELRTPLTTIVGYSELLEGMGELPDRSRQHAGAIRVAASQLARSIDDVLDMAQIDAGEMELFLGDVRVSDLLETTAETIRNKVEARGATLVVNCAPDLKPIRADSRRVSQALGYLAENATRAVTDGGTVTLSAEPGFNEVRLTVSDTGRGIAYHLQAHVFDRFVRRERGGPGVGLALVKALVELHGGWAEVVSEPGKGATFILHLPLTAAPASAMPELELQTPSE